MARHDPPPIPDVLKEKPGDGAPQLKAKEVDGTMQQLGKISAIGTGFAVTVAGGVLLGWAIQRWAAPTWAPWPIVVGSAAGLIAAGVRFVQDAKRLMADQASPKRKDK
jgi:F0F1-type ATP synthase assembly protein I